MGATSAAIDAEVVCGSHDGHGRAIGQANAEFALAYRAIVAYLVHARVIKDFQSRSLARELEARAIEQLDRAITVAAQIDSPDPDRAVAQNPIRMSNTALWMLRSDPQNENDGFRMRGRPRYWCDARGGCTTDRYVQAILALDRERRVELAAALGENKMAMSASASAPSAS